MTPRMLAALTGAPDPLTTVTGMPESFTACANSFAGRAWSPFFDPTRIVRVTCVIRASSRRWCGWSSGLLSRNGGFDESEGAGAVEVAEHVRRQQDDAGTAIGRVVLDAI